MQESGDREVLRHVGANVRRLRLYAGINQTELARRCGLSRRTMISVEAGATNISLSSLDHIAHALGTTFVGLVSAPAVAAAEVNEVAWRVGDSAATLLGSAPASREAQLWTWTLGAGERYDAVPDPSGWSELVWVAEGCLLVERDQGDVTLNVGDHAIYSSAQKYAYVNTGTIGTRFIRVVAS